MAQYCRYCAHMVCGDFNFCREKHRSFSDSQICKTNTCKRFELNPIDALGTGCIYQPREERAEEESTYTQQSFFDNE